MIFSQTINTTMKNLRWNCNSVQLLDLRLTFFWLAGCSKKAWQLWRWCVETTQIWWWTSKSTKWFQRWSKRSIYTLKGKLLCWLGKDQLGSTELWPRSSKEISNLWNKSFKTCPKIQRTNSCWQKRDLLKNYTLILRGFLRQHSQLRQIWQERLNFLISKRTPSTTLSLSLTLGLWLRFTISTCIYLNEL